MNVKIHSDSRLPNPKQKISYYYYYYFIFNIIVVFVKHPLRCNRNGDGI
jgi:hypothetical protein